MFGEGEWKVRQHGYVNKRLWSILHLAINCGNHMIEACELTDLGTQDCEGFTDLLNAIEDPIGVAIGDGAYDRFRCYEEVEKNVEQRVTSHHNTMLQHLKKEQGIEEKHLLELLQSEMKPSMVFVP